MAGNSNRPIGDTVNSPVTKQRTKDANIMARGPGGARKETGFRNEAPPGWPFSKGPHHSSVRRVLALHPDRGAWERPLGEWPLFKASPARK